MPTEAKIINLGCGIIQHQYVGFGRQVLKNRYVFLGSQIQGDSSFVGVQVEVKTAPVGVFCVAWEWPVPPSGVATRRLDFYHIRSCVGQQASAVSSRDHVPILQYFQVGQC